jgi:hypothetical protein
MNLGQARRPVSAALFTSGLIAAALVFAGTPAQAATCAEPVVQFLGIGAANITLATQNDGSFAGSVIVRVYCTDEAGNFASYVSNAQVSIVTNVPNTTFDGHVATTGSPALVDLPLGFKTITVTSTDPGLAPGVASARVGDQTATTTLAFGQAVPKGNEVTVKTNIFARTPELSSIALLASGGIGAAGYVLLAARSKRRRR